MDRGSMWMIVSANAAALVVAWWQQWPLPLLLWPYWIQNVVIGWYSRSRILALERFSNEVVSGLTGDSDEEIKRHAARFFAWHYGLIHFVYLLSLYLIHATGKFPDVGSVDAACIAALGVSFVLTHRASFKRNLENDRRGCPDIGTLMFVPYARVGPMHLIFILGMEMSFTGAVLLFGTLKTAADVLMHRFEHRFLATSARPKLEL